MPQEERAKALHQYPRRKGNIRNTRALRSDYSPSYFSLLVFHSHHRLYFSSDTPDFPQRLSQALLPPRSEADVWFCDFRAENTKYIVFHEKILTYRIGDAEGRALAVQECSKLGIPIEQTHWED